MKVSNIFYKGGRGKMTLFDSSAATYDDWCKTEIGSFVDQLEKDIMESLALPKEREKALDLGTGTGIYASLLQEKGVDVIGVDVSQKMLEKAIEKNPTLTFLTSDIHQLPFEDETFDLVVCNIVLEFVTHPEKVVEEVFRVLKKNGRFVCGFIGKESSWGEQYIKRGKEKKESVFASATFFTPEKAKELTNIPPEVIAYGLYVAPTEFQGKEQAMQMEKERAEAWKGKQAGYFAVRWKKSE